MTDGNNHVKGRDFLTAALLSLFLGIFAIDRFYLGKIGTGILKLITLSGLGVWYLIDLILILTGAMTDKAGRKLAGRDKNLKIALIIIGVVIALGLLSRIVAGDAPMSQTTLDNGTGMRDTEVVEADGATSSTPDIQPEKDTNTTVVKDIPIEHRSALTKAEMYANSMYMSKAGLYDQLVSLYGEKFSKEAAQYAIDNVKANWKANALEKAKMYQNDMAMSPAAIRDQLVSSYGEKFTHSEADYAIQHLND